MCPCNASINFNTSSSERTTDLVDAQFSSQDSIALQKYLSDGAGANQCNLIVEKRGPASASPDEIDLSLVSDQNGDLAAFASIKALIVCNKGADNPLEVSGSYFGATAAIVVPPGGALALIHAAGVTVTTETNDIITVGSAIGTDYEVRIVGVKVEEQAGE